MKKLLLSTLSVMAMGSASFAQVSITEADMSPIPTNSLIAVDTIANFPSPSLIAGNPGSGQTWDFSTLVATSPNANALDITDTVIYTNPGFTPNGNAFPNANYGVINVANGNQTYVYANKSSSLIEVVGIVIKDPTGATQNDFFGNSSPTEIIFNFPFVFGSAFTNFSQTVIVADGAPFSAAAGFQIDSVRITQGVTKEVVADASGTLTTPAFTNIPVLRVKISKLTTTQVDIKIPFLGWQNNAFPVPDATSKNYQWFADNKGTAIADATIDTIQGNDDILRVTWLYAAPTASIKEVSANEVNIFPNPAATFVNFKFENAVSKLVVYDVTGKLINTLTVTGNAITLNTEVYANGLYIYKALDKTGTANYTGKFNIVK